MSYLDQQRQRVVQLLAQGVYPAAPIPVPPLPWPPGGGTAPALGSIQAGYLVPLLSVLPGATPLQKIILPTHESPPSSVLPFNFAPGTEAVQIQTTSWPCRKIVFYAPSTNSLPIFMGTQGVGYGAEKAYPIVPGQPGEIDIADVIIIYWVAGNLTDIIQGWAESDL